MLARPISAVLLLALLGCTGTGGDARRDMFPKSAPITDVRLGEFKAYKASVGDTWDPAWADDDNLYAASNDTSGWDEAASSNIAFNRLAGDDFFNLTGRTVNPMAESGAWGAGEGPDGRTWKSSGCICVDGTLYLVVGRHMYGDKSKDPFRRQTAINSSILKSTDHGLTWTPSYTNAYQHPMFPANHFPTPYFIYYGKDGAAPPVDRAAQYIYAVSNNGFWNNGDKYFLGRVRRSELPRLEASDWEFYLGGDGALDRNWSKEPRDAATLIDNPTRCGMTGATYIPALGRYLLIAWYYPRDMNTESDETRFIYYEAQHPWGPWTAIREDINRPAGWYSPRLLAKWQRAKGGEVQAVVATAGDFWEIPWFYKFTVLPLTIKANGKFPPPPPRPTFLEVGCRQMGTNLAQFRYEGDWKYIERDKDLGVGEFCATHAGDKFTIAFRGTRIRWYSCKGNAVGIAKVSIDGLPEITLDLWTRWAGETLYNRLAFDSGQLSAGRHTLTVEVTGAKNPQSLATSVFNERLEIEK